MEKSENTKMFVIVVKKKERAEAECLIEFLFIRPVSYLATIPYNCLEDQKSFSFYVPKIIHALMARLLNFLTFLRYPIEGILLFLDIIIIGLANSLLNINMVVR